MIKQNIKINELHERENSLNKELNKLDKTITECLRKKKKITIAISKLVRYRNQIIKNLKDENSRRNIT
jgi:hypothetical protein